MPIQHLQDPESERLLKQDATGAPCSLHSAAPLRGIKDLALGPQQTTKKREAIFTYLLKRIIKEDSGVVARHETREL